MTKAGFGLLPGLSDTVVLHLHTVALLSGHATSGDDAHGLGMAFHTWLFASPSCQVPPCCILLHPLPDQSSSYSRVMLKLTHRFAPSMTISELPLSSFSCLHRHICMPFKAPNPPRIDAVFDQGFNPRAYCLDALEYSCIGLM